MKSTLYRDLYVHAETHVHVGTCPVLTNKNLVEASPDISQIGVSKIGWSKNIKYFYQNKKYVDKLLIYADVIYEEMGPHPVVLRHCSWLYAQDHSQFSLRADMRC